MCACRLPSLLDCRPRSAHDRFCDITLCSCCTHAITHALTRSLNTRAHAFTHARARLPPPQHYNLVDEKELAPLQELIDQFLGRAGSASAAGTQ